VEGTLPGRVQAIFQEGGEVTSIQTSFKSRKVKLSNLPLQSQTNAEIIATPQKVGDFKPLNFHPTHPQAIPRTAEAEYF